MAGKTLLIKFKVDDKFTIQHLYKLLESGLKAKLKLPGSSKPLSKIRYVPGEAKGMIELS